MPFSGLLAVGSVEMGGVAPHSDFDCQTFLAEGVVFEHHFSTDAPRARHERNLVVPRVAGKQHEPFRVVLGVKVEASGVG